ncbi:Concanavalin A-like lectin/glucanases superfamily protein [Micromonospora sediminimaris]|nr:Concanavalin A-like lectin/glucanases superfamily protein [Micromonospora sediminimaris]
MSWKRRACSGLLAASMLVAGLIAGPTSSVASTPAPSGTTTVDCTAREAADEAAAAELALACDRPVEVLSARTEYAQVVIDPSGTRTLRTSVAPQRVRRADGSWRPIDPALGIRDGRLAPAVTTADVSFSPGGGGPLVVWRQGDDTFTLTWPLGPLPVPDVVGATATYRSVLEDVNLHVTATAQGYSHVVELLTSQAAANPLIRSLRYLTGGDLRVERGTAGTLRLVDRSGATVAVSALAQMWDSSSDPARAGEVRASVTEAGVRASATSGEPATAAEPAVTSRTAEVVVSVAGNELSVAPDPTLLADSKLTYPVFVDPQFEKLRSKWAYSSSNGENNETSRARVGRQPEPEGGNGEMYRSYYDFNISGLKGKKVIRAEVRVTLDHSYSCDPTFVYAYRTSAITVSSAGRMAWKTRPLPATYLDSWEGNANEAGGCGRIQPDTDAEFVSSRLNEDLQSEIDDKSSTYTVGLCACNPSGEGESLQGRWKKFYTNQAWLEVTYNTPPATPTSLSTSSQACGATIGTASPVLRAYYGDADASGDSLVGYFEYQQLPSGAVVAKTGQTRPGNSYGESGTISLGAASEGKTYQWRVRTRDAAGDYSKSWSGWCSFTVDVSRPPRPGVTSSLYRNDGTAAGGPGVGGPFTFTAGAPDVVKYVYGWTGQTSPLTTVAVSEGSSHTAQLTPPKHGLNVLNVYSVDKANKRSDTNAYEFLVGSPSNPLAHWPLDTIDGHGLSDQISGRHLHSTGSVGWASDTRIYGESHASFDGSSYLSADGVPLDTSRSFSVAAWVRLADADPSDPDPDLPTANWNAIGKSGSKVSSFYLGARIADGQLKWNFLLPSHDVETGNTMVEALSPVALTTRDVGRWTHLAGVYDAHTKQVQLYVDGQLVRSAPRATAPWKANGPLVVGTGLWTVDGEARMTDRWRGQIADVRLWDRVLTWDDLWGTDSDEAAGTHELAGLLAPVEIASWDFNGATYSGCSPMMSATYWSQLLDLYGCEGRVEADQSVGYTGDSHDGNDALWLNTPQPDGQGSAGNRDGYAATSGPVLNSGQSLTVSAWVRVDVNRSEEQVIFRQGWSERGEGAFKLSLWPASQKWQFALFTPEFGGGGTWATAAADQTASIGDWVHVVGVFDGGAAEVRIYVNGIRQVVHGSGAVGAASQAPLYVGAGRPEWGYLEGGLDQLKLFAGAMSDREVASLHHTS